MLLPIPCTQCRFPAGKSIDEGVNEFVEFELANDAVYIGKCSKGHRVTAIQQNLKHEILFESGAVAHLCGFHREAFTSFWVAMERFFEFATHVFLRELGAESEQRARAWKAVDHQSERQLGAFFMLYLACCKEPFPHDLSKLAGERNRVIHKGELPTGNETRNFAKSIFDIVDSVTVKLINEHSLAFIAVRMHPAFDRSVVARARAGESVQSGEVMSPSNVAVPMMLSAWREAPAEPAAFDTAFEHLRRRMSWYGHSEQTSVAST